MDKKKEKNIDKAMSTKASGVCSINFDKLKNQLIEQCKNEKDPLKLKAFKISTQETCVKIQTVVDYIESHPNSQTAKMHKKDISELKDYIKWYKGTFLKMIDKKI